jgi:hypothetical protein
MAGKRINDYDKVNGFNETDLFLVDRVDDTKYVAVEWGTIEGIVDDKVSAEKTEREAADSALQGNIDTEKTERESADSELHGKIDTEKTERESADSALQGNIDTEKTERETGDVDTLDAAKAYTDQQVNQISLETPVPDSTPPEAFSGDFAAFVTDVWGKLAYLYQQIQPEPPPDP